MFIKTREYQELFLEALRAGIRGQRVAWKERSVQEWSGFLPWRTCIMCCRWFRRRWRSAGSGFGGPCDVCKSAGKESTADGTSEDDDRRISGVVRSFTTDGCKAAGGKRNRLPQSVPESRMRGFLLMRIC